MQSWKKQIILFGYDNVPKANYPEIGNVKEVCAKAPDRLTSDLQSAIDFTTRYKGLKAAYEAQANCAAQVKQAVSEVALPEMAQAPSIVSSMVSTIQADLNSV